MVEPWSVVPVVFHAQLRTNSKKIQELVHINLGLPQQTSECSDFDRFLKRNHATLAAASHHNVAALRHEQEP